MKVWKYIKKKVGEGPFHFTLLDPDREKQTIEGILKISQTAFEAGTDAILLGGSTSIEKELLDSIILSIKDLKTGLPIILFPSSVGYLSEYADAVLFMSLLNSTDVRFVIREPAKGVLIIEKMGIEPISMGYIIIEPGMTVGKIGKAELIRKDDIPSAVKYGIVAQNWGMKMVYLEAGSGSPISVPNDMIKAVKSKLTRTVLIVGGGITDGATAIEKIRAGANAIVTGTIAERDIKRLKEIISAIKQV